MTTTHDKLVAALARLEALRIASERARRGLGAHAEDRQAGLSALREELGGGEPSGAVADLHGDLVGEEMRLTLAATSVRAAPTDR